MPKWLWITLIGVALLLPRALYWCSMWISDPVTTADTRTAFRRLAAVRLDAAVGSRGVDITATTPSDASWRRVVRNWGDPGYFIGVVLPRPRTYMYCLQDLGARVEARIGDQPVDLETAYVPYGYSSDCQPAGLLFRAPPGSVVRIHVTVARLPSHAADLVVEPYWAGETKDRLVGTALDDDLREITTALGVAGIGAILIAAFLFSRRTHPPAG